MKTSGWNAISKCPRDRRIKQQQNTKWHVHLKRLISQSNMGEQKNKLFFSSLCLVLHSYFIHIQ